MLVLRPVSNESFVSETLSIRNILPMLTGRHSAESYLSIQLLSTIDCQLWPQRLVAEISLDPFSFTAISPTSEARYLTLHFDKAIIRLLRKYDKYSTYIIKYMTRPLIQHGLPEWHHCFSLLSSFGWLTQSAQSGE